MSFDQQDVQPEEQIEQSVNRALINRLSLIPRLLKASAGVMGVPLELVNSDARTPLACRARFIAMYISYTYFNMSKSLIGRRIHGRDHTTVMSGIKRCEKLMAESIAFAAKVEEVRAIIEGSRLLPMMISMEELAAMPASKPKPKVTSAKRSRERPKAVKEPGPVLCFTDEDVRRVTMCLADRLRSYHPEMEDRRVMVRMKAVA